MRVVTLTTQQEAPQGSDCRRNPLPRGPGLAPRGRGGARPGGFSGAAGRCHALRGPHRRQPPAGQLGAEVPAQMKPPREPALPVVVVGRPTLPRGRRDPVHSAQGGQNPHGARRPARSSCARRGARRQQWARSPASVPDPCLEPKRFRIDAMTPTRERDGAAHQSRQRSGTGRRQRAETAELMRFPVSSM